MPETIPHPQDPLAEPRRIASLDAARAIAALLVVCQHSFETFVPSIPKSFAILNLGQVGVVCFFLISGFVIPYSLQSHGSLLKYAISRVFRIFPLYWAVLMITCFLLWLRIPVLGHDAMNALSWRSFAVHIFMIQSLFKIPNMVGISWTLVIEMVFYFVTAFVFLIKPSSLLRLIVLSCCLVLGASLLGFHFHKSLPIYPAALILTAFAGQAVEYQWSGRITRLQARVILIVILLTCLVSIAIREACLPYDISTRTVCVSWIGGYATFLVMLATRGKSNAASFLGRISYSTYLLHPLIITLLFYYFHASWMLIIACFIGTVAAATLTFDWIEQPGIAIGKSLFKKILRARTGQPSFSRQPVA